MGRRFISLAACAAAMLALPAHAEVVSFTMNAEDGHCGFGPCISLLGGQMVTSLSSSLVDAINAAGLSLSAVGAGVASGAGFNLSLPLAFVRGQLSGDFGSWNQSQENIDFQTTRFGSFGASGMRVSQADGHALEFKDLRVDPSTKMVHAKVLDLAGTPGSTQAVSLPFLSYATGVSSVPMLRNGDHPGTFSINDLTLTPEALTLLRQSFRLDDASIAALSSTGGSMSINYELNMRGMAVPELSTWAMMGLGLSGVMAMRTRRRGASQLA